MSHSYAGSENGNVPVLPPHSSLSICLDEASRVGEARRSAMLMASALGFGDAKQSNLAIVVTEAANNIRRHAQSGEMVLRPLECEGIGGVEVLALDKGPGIQNLEQCLEDGFSTGGTSGNGLGAIKRLSDSFSVYSEPGQGTALLAICWAKPVKNTQNIDLGVVNRPKPGEYLCGDNWAMKSLRGQPTFLVVDGLGHGPDAAKAAREAVTCFEDTSSETPSVLLNDLHGALKGTRGAAVAVAQFDAEASKMTFAGVGNISGIVVHGETSNHMMSYFGIVGYQVRKIQEMTYLCEAGNSMILSSDGIATLGPLSAYPGLWEFPAALIAGVLYRDFQRVNDDATILVVKFSPVPQVGESSL